MGKGLAMRRHNRWRMLRKALRLLSLWDRTFPKNRRPNEHARLADNLARCSCFSCQNPNEPKWHERKERLFDVGEG